MEIVNIRDIRDISICFVFFCQGGDPDKKHSSRECDGNWPGPLLLRTVMADEDEHTPPGMKLAEHLLS